MARLLRRGRIDRVPRMRKGSWMLEWKPTLLALLVVFASAAGELVSGYNWNW
jgi:hypothetical protein